MPANFQVYPNRYAGKTWCCRRILEAGEGIVVKPKGKVVGGEPSWALVCRRIDCGNPLPDIVNDARHYAAKAYPEVA